MIRGCGDGERDAILAIINAAAERYRGVIPPDRWHEPYMSRAELDGEIAAGVRFAGFESDGALLGIMGIQSVEDVDLIRHAYVTPAGQGARRRPRAARAPAGRDAPAAAGRDVGHRRVGDPLLRAQRLRQHEPGAQDGAAAPVLGHPRAAGADVGGAGP